MPRIRQTPVIAALLALAWAHGAVGDTEPSGVLDIGSELPLLQLKDGRTYRDATVTGHDEDGVSIRHQGGVVRITYDLFPATMSAEAMSLQKSFAAPPSRFSGETLKFFSAISSPRYVHGQWVEARDSRIDLVRLSKTSDPLLQQAVDTALELVRNRDDIEYERRGLEERRRAAILETSEETGSEGSADPETRTKELEIESLRLGQQLRNRITAIARRDLPKSDHVTSPISTRFIQPGMLCIANHSGRTLHHCLFMTETTLAGAETTSDGKPDPRNVCGFVAYVPELRNWAEAVIPFCDSSRLPDARKVRLSLWTDEHTGEDEAVRGLRELRIAVARETEARVQRQEAEARQTVSPPSTSTSPLVTGERLNLKPKIPRNPNNPLHQGNGAKLFER